jgi:hypothetical protein
MTLLTSFAMNPIMKDGRIEHQPQAEAEDENARELVPAGDEHSNADVSDDHPHSERDDETNLGGHQVAHSQKPTSRAPPYPERFAAER